MRHTIGQSDLTPMSIGEWSFDMLPTGVTSDPNLTYFNLTQAGRDMVSWLTRMQAVAQGQTSNNIQDNGGGKRHSGSGINDNRKGVFLLGSIWSPPQWMKQDNTLHWGYVDTWVEYIVNYLTTYRESGIEVDALTMQVGYKHQLHRLRSEFALPIEVQFGCSSVVAVTVRPCVSLMLNRCPSTGVIVADCLCPDYHCCCDVYK